MPYAFSHCASRYEDSRQLDRCPAALLIQRLLALGVKLDSIVDFGTGTGFWLMSMERSGLLTGKTYAVDISDEMLDVVQRKGIKAQYVHGSLDELAKIDLKGVQTIFLCMVAHLLEFPNSLAELTRLAERSHIQHVVVIEEVSFLYHVLAGNPHYLALLPEGISVTLQSYLRHRSETAVAPIEKERNAPYPMPSMEVSSWRKLGLRVQDYYFETPKNLGWSWWLSPADIVSEVRSRGYSICFGHSTAEATLIAEQMHEELRARADYETKQEVPFWFNVHLFQTVGVDKSRGGHGKTDA